jgi:hypothetical protein
MDSGGTWAERRLVDHLLVDAMHDDAILDARCISAWIRSASSSNDIDMDSIRALEQLDFDYMASTAWCRHMPNAYHHLGDLAIG